MTAERVSGRRLNLDEYFALDEASEVRHEFVDGVAFAMSGGTPSHSLITANLIATLHRALAGSPCRTFSSDLRIATLESRFYTYPDVAVVCGEYLTDPRSANTVVNPSLLVEVLSPSTEAWDRGGKFELYRRIASLQEYVLVSQHRPLVEHYVRQDRGWLLRLAVGLDGEWTPACAGVTYSPVCRRDYWSCAYAAARLLSERRAIEFPPAIGTSSFPRRRESRSPEWQSLPWSGPGRMASAGTHLHDVGLTSLHKTALLNDLAGLPPSRE